MRRPTILCLLVITLFVNACGSSVPQVQYNLTICPSTTNNPPAPEGKQSVSLTVTGLSTSPERDRFLTEQVTNFQRLYPNIQIRWNLLKGNYSAFIHAAIENGNAPDVFYLQPDMLNDYLKQGQLLDLTPYLQRDHMQASAYYPELFKAFSCEKGQYGIPDGWNTLGIFYNKQKFRAADIPQPAADWTWKDMEAIAKKMTWIGETPEYGVILPMDASYWLPFLLANGGSVLSADGKHAAFNSEAGVEALSFYVSFQRKDHSSVLPSEVSSAWSNNVAEAFGLQRASMVLDESELLPYLQANYTNIAYDVAPLPLAPTGKRANPIFAHAWAIYSQTRHADAAWTFLQYMSGEDVQRNMLHAGLALPSLQRLADDPYFGEKPALKRLLQNMPEGYIDNFGPYSAFIHDRLNLALSSVLFGKADARTALDRAAQQINKVLNP